MLGSAVAAAAACAVGFTSPAWADTVATVSAQVQSYRPQFIAYAQVVPIQVLTVRAGIDGVVEGLSPVPGQQLKAGDVIARIGGPEQADAMQQASAKLAAAERSFQAALDAEKSTAQVYPGFADRRRLDRAKEELAAARERLADAKAELTRLQSLSAITSPVAGTVASLRAANGERVSPGSPVLVMQPEHDLWLEAIYYEVPSAVLSPGRRAAFRPANGAAPLPVRLAQVAPSVRPDGGLPVFFEADAAAPGWRAGQSGEVVIEGQLQEAVSVPTEALILDHGRWWVLEKTPSGLQHRAVEIGPSVGERTILLDGLRAGARVVVRDAYPLFHRDFGQHYMPPD
jgi:RND family efflux transporter MFP subunit